MAVRTFQIGTSRRRGEGLRVGTVRFLPRGVFKTDYAKLDYFDVWLPILAPSRKLLRWAKRREWEAETRRKFFAAYRKELLSDTDSKQTVILLAELSKATNLSVGCYCEDESRCHRSVLMKVLRQAIRGRLPN